MMASLEEEEPQVDVTMTTASVSREPPDRLQFEKSLSEISEEINKKQKLIEPSLLLVTKDLGEQLKASSKVTEEAEEEKRSIAMEIKSIDEKIKKLGANITKERDQSNRLVASLKYKSAETYDEQIKKLELQLQGGAHFSFNDRRKLQQTIESLSEAKIKLKDYLVMRETIDKCRTEQDELRKRKDVLHQRNKSCRERSTKSRDQSEYLRKEIDKRKATQKEKKTEQETITKELNTLYQKRKKLKDDFRQKQTDYINYLKSAPPSIKTTTPTQTNEQKPHKHLSLHKSWDSQRTRVRGGDLFEEEKTICQTLTNYLSRLSGSSPLLLRHPQTPSPSSYSPENTPNIITRELPSSAVTREREREGYQVIQRNDGEEEGWIPAGHRDRKERKKSKKERRKSFSGLKTYSKPLQHNATIFEQFNKLGLHPPISIGDIPLITDQLRSLMIRYTTYTTTESEAGDSGIMSSAGISEYSDIGLPSGETTPPNNHTHSNSDETLPLSNHSPLPEHKQYSETPPILDVMTTPPLADVQ